MLAGLRLLLVVIKASGSGGLGLVDCRPRNPDSALLMAL
jgi:hypothetical protein